MKTGVVLALFLGASVAHAAGLGKLTVNSSLGQVLNAEIDLVSLQPGELDSLSARVAPAEAFRDARIEYSSSLRLLRFSVEKRANGSPYLKVTSVAPINEPFVDALIEVTWPQGRIQREYPILLDPPGYAQGRAPAPPTVAAAPASRTPETPATAPASSSSAPAAASVTPAPSAPSTAGTGSPSASAELVKAPGGTEGGDTYGPVQKGDTLRKIAEEVKPSNVSLEQMLVALYRENKSAFVNNNMNRLKAGQILKVPSGDDVSKLERKEVNTEIKTHVADWKSYREGLAGGVASLPARAESSSPAASSGRIASAAVAPPAAPTDAPKDVLKLSKTDKGGKAAAGKGGASDREARLQEELTAKEKALQESQSRVADLEKQIQNMQRLMDLKAGGKADAKVAVAPPPPAVPAKPEPAKVEPPKAATPAPTPAKPEPAKVEPVPAKPADTKVAEAPKADAAKPGEPPKPADAAKPAEAPKVAEAKPAPPKTDAAKAPPKKAAAPPPPKGFVDEMLDNPLYLGIGALALAGLGVGGFLFMRRRKQAQEYAPSSSMMGSTFPSDLKVDSTTAKAGGGGLVDTGNSSFLTDFDKAGPGTIDTDEVDPVAEAEVYIAYGRDAQAEEILKEAMARDSSRPEIALKLLEIYHARKSATAFEAVAKPLHEQLGEGSPQWQKAAAMGAQIDPNNPLYAGASGATASFAAAPAAEPAKPQLDFDIAGSGGGGASADSAPAPDFNLETSQTSAPSSGLDFDINAPSTSAADIPVEAPKEEAKPNFDFDLSGLDFPGTKPAESAPAPAASSSSGMDFADLTLDTPSAPAGDAGGAEGVGTKLELAKAYLEIGDKDGAREILQEVAKEGSAAQKEEAQKLIASL